MRAGDEPARESQLRVHGPPGHGREVRAGDEPARARKGEKYVTVIIDLTPIRDGSGPARL